MNNTSKLSHAESKAREAKKAVRRVMRNRQIWSHDYPQHVNLETGPVNCYKGVWCGKPKDSLSALRALLANGLDRKSREIVARNTKIVRTQRIK
jgi:hypothetical protein